MCGRYYFNEKAKGNIFRIADDYSEGIAAYPEKDVFPSQEAPVLYDKDGMLAADLMRWGFENSVKGGFLINARAETCRTKKTFADSMARRRCVMPAAGFYEWTKAKEKVDFSAESGRPLYLAGFYNLSGGRESFIIITKEADESVSPVHDRMPLIFTEEEIRLWIFGKDYPEMLDMKAETLLAKRDYEQLTFSFDQEGQP